MQLQPGDLVLNGKYQIERLLGEGATAEVYLANQTRLRLRRALKILRRDRDSVGSTEVRDYRERFTVEAQLQASFSGNPRIAQVFDLDTQSDSPVLVMEWAEGGSLQQEIDRAAGRAAAITVARCAAVLTDIADGLAALHAAGYVHRDIKPSNVLLDRDGRARISDLGLAQTPQTVDRSDGRGHLPHPGTAGYMSPEHGDASAYLTPAADMYAVGVIGWLMLTSQMPSVGVTVKPSAERRAPVPDWFDALLSSALAVDPALRPANGARLAELLRAGQSRDEEDARRQAEAASVLKRRVRESLAARQFEDADRIMSELSLMVPDDPDVAKLSREVNLALIGEKARYQRLQEAAENRDKLRATLGREDWVAAVAASEAWLLVSPGEPEAEAGRATASARIAAIRQIAAVRERAVALVKARDWSAAANAVADWRGLDPHNSELPMMDRAVADGQARERQMSEAREAAESAIRQGDWSAADAALSRWEALEPGDLDARAAISRTRAELDRMRRVDAARARARAAAHARDWTVAHAAAAEWALLEPDDEGARRALASADAELAILAEATDMLRQCELRIAARDWDGAAAALKRRLELAPADSAALSAEIAIREGRENQHRAVALRMKVETAFELDDLVGAAKAVEAWESLAPDDPDLLVAHGRLKTLLTARKALDDARDSTYTAMAAGDWAVATDRVTSWLALSGSSAVALQARDRIAREVERLGQIANARTRAMALLDAANWRQAAEAIRQWLSLAPGDERAKSAERAAADGVSRLEKLEAHRRELAQWLARGDWAGALAAVRLILALEPADPSALAARDKVNAEHKRAADLMAVRAEVERLMTHERWADAAEAVDRWLKLDPSDSQAAAAKARVHRKVEWLANIDEAGSATERLIAARAWIEADAALKRWTALVPAGSPAAQAFSAALCAAGERIAGGLAELRRIAELRRFVDIDISRRNWQAASANIASWLHLAPEDPPALAAQKLVGEEIARLRRIDEARLETRLLASQSRWPEARAAARRWLEDVPKDAEALSTLSTADQWIARFAQIEDARAAALKLIAEGRWREAIAATAQWRALDPKSNHARERSEFVASQVEHLRRAEQAAREVRRLLSLERWEPAVTAVELWAQLAPGDSSIDSCRAQARDGAARARRIGASRLQMRDAILKDRLEAALQAAAAWVKDAPQSAVPQAAARAASALIDARQRATQARGRTAAALKAGRIVDGLRDLVAYVSLAHGAVRRRRRLVWKYALSPVGKAGRLLVDGAIVALVLGGLMLFALVSGPCVVSLGINCQPRISPPVPVVAIPVATSTLTPPVATASPGPSPIASIVPSPRFVPAATVAPAITATASREPATATPAAVSPIAVSDVTFLDRDPSSAVASFNYTISPEWVAGADRVLFYAESDAPPGGGERALAAVGCDSAPQVRLNTASVGLAAATGCLLPFNTDRSTPSGALRLFLAPPEGYRAAATLPFSTTRVTIVAVTWLKAGGIARTELITLPYSRLWR